MAESVRDVKIRFGIESDGKEGIAGIREEVEKLGPAGEKAGKDLEKGLDGASDAMQELKVRNDALVATLEKIDSADAAGAYGKMGRLAALAAVQLDELKNAAQRAGVEGTEAGRRLEDGMKKADVAIDKASKSAAKFRDVAGDMKTRADFAAKGAESLASSVGSVDGILGKMADSSSGAANRLATLGFQLTAIIAVFKLAYEAGVKFREMFPTLAKKMDLSEPIARFLTGIDMSDRKLKDWNVTAQSNIGKHNEMKMAVENSTEALFAGVPAFAAQKKASEEAGAQTKLFEQALAGWVKRGDDLTKTARDNYKAITEWADSVKAADGNLGRLTDKAREMVKVAEDQKRKVEEWGKATEEAYKKALKLADEKIAKAKKEAEETSKASDAEIAAYEKEIKAAKMAGESREVIRALEEKMLEAIERGTEARREAAKVEEEQLDGIRKLAGARGEATAAEDEAARATRDSIAAEQDKARALAETTAMLALQRQAWQNQDSVAQKAGENHQKLVEKQKEVAKQTNENTNLWDLMAESILKVSDALS